MFALIDCNNFYASCERLFRPDLHNKPVVILSGNDGAIIARSNEAKALGIPMGEPFFKIKSICQQYKVHVFSSNFTLYRDISQRIMSIIQDAWKEVEIYSIDEAFLNLDSLPPSLHVEFCETLRHRILQYTGIPVSIGIGPSKTLAKIANHICKKELRVPVFNIHEQRDWLKRISVGDVWGVGRKWHKKLLQQGIYTADDLARYDIHQLKKQYNVILMRTAMELQGISCLQLEEMASKKSLLSSRSFGEMQTSFDVLAQALSAHCTNAYTKLRKQKQVVQSLYVFVRTNRFRNDLAQYNPSIQIQLEQPSDDLRLITHCAKQGLRQIFRTGFFYKKIGVCFDGLTSKQHRQLDIFNPLTDADVEKSDQFLQVFDAINRKFGQHTIKLAAEGFQKNWAARAELKSPAYTTRWTDLRRVN